MASQLQIDQAGLVPAGTPGVSRTDGKADGSVVTLTNTGSGSTTLFRLLDVPLNDVSAEASLAPTGNPKIWEFTPTGGARGTYLIELIEDENQPTEKRERRIFGVRTAATGLLIPALNEIADPNSSLILDGPAQIEASDDNSQDYTSDTDLNARRYAGWWRKLYELFIVADNGAGGGSPSNGPLNAVQRSDGAGAFLGSVNFEYLETATTAISRLTSPDALAVNVSLTIRDSILAEQLALRFDESTDLRTLLAQGDLEIESSGGALTLNGGVPLIWPATDGSAGQQLTTDGAGNLSWANASSPSLQVAYEGGNTIVTDVGNGAFDVSGTENISLFGDAVTVSAAGDNLINSTGGDTRLRSVVGDLRLERGAVAWFWPGADGSVGQGLVTDGAGVLSFADVGEPSQGTANVLNVADGSGGWTATNVEVSGDTFSATTFLFTGLGGPGVTFGVSGFGALNFAATGVAATGMNFSAAEDYIFTGLGAASMLQTNTIALLDFNGTGPGSSVDFGSFADFSFSAVGPGSNVTWSALESFSIAHYTGPTVLLLNDTTAPTVAAGRLLSWDGTQNVYIDPPTGDVVGPVSSTDNAIVRWDGVGGDTLQNSGVTIDDSNNITMGDSFLIGRRFQAISPAAIAAQQDNYNPAGLATADSLRLTFTGNQTITGIVAPGAGAVVEKKILNIDTVDVLTLTNEDLASTAANRILTPAGTPLLVYPADAVTIRYDFTTLRWRVVGVAKRPLYKYLFLGEHFNTTLGTDWALDSSAEITGDSNVPVWTVARFDGGAGNDEGIGINFDIPDGVTTITLEFYCRRESGTGTPSVQMAFAARSASNDAAITAWSAFVDSGPDALDNIDMVASENWLRKRWTVPISTLNLVAGAMNQMQIIRDPDDLGDNMAEDFVLRSVGIELR